MLGYEEVYDTAREQSVRGFARCARILCAMPSPHLGRKLKDVLGDDAGEELASVIDRIDPIRGDIAELRHEAQMTAARLEALLERGLRGQTRFFFLAWGVQLAAIVGLYGTLVALVR